VAGTLRSQRIKFQADLDLTFGARIAHRAGGEDFSRCIQCGTCSATCPVSLYMEHTPRRIIAMTRAGFRREVLASNTIWMCASCYACTTDCPREIHITDVMYALKREAIQAGKYPRRFSIPVLARAFCATVRRNGRNNEAQLLVTAFLFTNPMKLLRNAPLAMKLMGHGRLPLFERGIGGLGKKVRTLLDHVDRVRRSTPVRPQAARS
jgi:quinone-modifying oxidoreductase, subunit QmoC